MKQDYTGIKYYMLSSLKDNGKDFYKHKGLYIYDLRESCLYGDGGTIAKSVLVNNCGSIVTNKKLEPVEAGEEIDLDDFMDSATEFDYDEFNKLLKKPLVKAPIIGANGNVFNLIAICQRELKLNGYKEEAKELFERISNTATSYDMALQIMMEYVEPVTSVEMDDKDLEC